MSKKINRHTRKSEQPSPEAIKSGRVAPLIGSAVAFITFVAFSRVLFNDFVNYDDDMYVTANETVISGLSWDGMIYIILDTATGNWHPMTMLSHMVDSTLFGLNPMGHHLTSLVLHTANTGLLFFALYRMTGMIGPSAAVALLFGIHPLHVVSVAHVSQRKDVLSTFFWLLTMLLYARYVTTGRARNLAGAVATFGIGLSAKSMLVSLPIVLLLLDIWPLQRLTINQGNRRATIQQTMRLLREKIPFFALAFVLALVTFAAQRESGATAALQGRPLFFRLQNATVSYVEYLMKTVWPTDLAAFYPYPAQIPLWKFAGAALLLSAATVLAITCLKRRPYVTVGWFWYLITLLPVIGIVQVGAQAWADRYSYVPLIGIFIVLAWGIQDAIRVKPRLRPPLQGAVCVATAILVVLSWIQIGTWRNSFTLWNHAIAVTDNNHIAQCNLGMAYVEAGDLATAEPYFLESLRIEPGFGLAKHNLANIYAIRGVQLRQAGRHAEALINFAEALELEPGDYDILVEIGQTYAAAQDYPKAIEAYSAALQRQPESAEVRYYLGIAFEKAGDAASAIRELETALQIRPDSERAHSALERVRRESATPGSR